MGPVDAGHQRDRRAAVLAIDGRAAALADRRDDVGELELVIVTADVDTRQPGPIVGLPGGWTVLLDRGRYSTDRPHTDRTGHTAGSSSTGRGRCPRPTSGRRTWPAHRTMSS